MHKKQINYIVEKSSDDSKLTLSFSDTIEHAKSWIGSAEKYRILDANTGELIEAKDAEYFERFPLGGKSGREEENQE